MKKVWKVDVRIEINNLDLLGFIFFPSRFSKFTIVCPQHLGLTPPVKNPGATLTKCIFLHIKNKLKVESLAGFPLFWTDKIP